MMQENPQEINLEGQAEEEPKSPALEQNQPAPPKRSKKEMVKSFFKNIFLLIRQALHDYATRLFLFFIVITSLHLEDAIGFVYLVVTIILLITERKNNWNHGWISYSLISFIVFGAQIYFVAKKNLRPNEMDMAAWLGFGLSGGKVVGVFILNFFIFLLSVLLGIFVHTKSIVMTDREYREARRTYGPVLNEAIEIFEDQEVLGHAYSTEHAEEKKGSELNQLAKGFQNVKLRYYYRKVTRFVERFYHKHGYEFALLFMMILAFYSLNVLSILYVLIAIYFSLSTKHFYDHDPNSRRLRSLQLKWRFFYFLMAVDLIRQYFFTIWFPLSWNIRKIFMDESFTCNEAGKTTFSPVAPYSQTDDYRVCVDSWRAWFTLDVSTTSRLFIYFFTLFLMVLYDRYFFPYKVQQFRYEEGDDMDFTNPENRSLVDHLRFFFYCHFYIVPVLLFIGVGIRLNITGQTDVISAVYFFLGLFLLFRYKRLLRKRTFFWNVIELWNGIMLLLIVLFQVPLIPCPIAISNRYFFSLNECIDTQEQYNALNANSLNRINSAKPIYTIVDIIGINKVPLLSVGNSSKVFLMIFFFFFAIVQRKIWQHPFITAYVIPFYEKKEKYNLQIAAKYVERVHLKRVIAYKAILLDQDLTGYYEKKIEDKIRGWEALFTESGAVDREAEEFFRTRRGTDEGDRMARAFRILDEITNEIPDSKILSRDEFIDLVRRCNYEKEEVEKEVKFEIKKAKATVIRELRKIPQINFPSTRGPTFDLTLALPEEEKQEERPVPVQEGQPQEFGTRVEERKEGEEEERKEEEGNEGEEREGTGGSRRMPRTPKTPRNKLEEILLEDEAVPLQGEEEHGGDVSQASPMRSTIRQYDDIDLEREEDPERKTFKDKLKFWLVKQIRSSSLIGEIQAKLLIGDSLFVLIVNLLLVNIDKITYLIFVVNHLVNASVLSVIFPLSMVLYGAIEYPTPSTKYWRIMLYYTLILLMLKFVYQLPFFCGTPPYKFNNIFNTDDYGCDVYLGESYHLATRYDYIIGIVKFTGDSSYPFNQGLFRGLLMDILTFICLVLVRFTMDSAGIWNHVKIYNSFKFVPQLAGPPQQNSTGSGSGSESPLKAKGKEKEGEKKEEEKEKEGQDDKEKEDEKKKKEKEKKDKKDKKKKRDWGNKSLLGFIRNMFSFNHYVSGQASVRKPGYNYYGYMAPLSLVILIYFIFFFSAMVGSGQSITEELNRSLFSGGLVITITFIILYMLFERVVYVSRDTIFQKEIDPDEEGVDANNVNKGENIKKVILSKQLFIKILSHYILSGIVLAFFCYIMIRARAQESTGNYVSIVFGFLFCILYLFFSAQQIKFGYSLAVDTRFFHSTDDITVLMFKIYRAVPFLYEIASILDWTASKTSLELFQWMRIEDAYANLYLAKKNMETRRERRIGTVRTYWERFSSGCLIVILLVLVVILPIILFSTLNPSQELNNVISGTVTIDLQGISPINNVRFTLYQVQNLEISSLTEEQLNEVKGMNAELGEYDNDQIQRITIPNFSENEWAISVPSLETLVNILLDPTYTFFMTANWYFNRENPRDSAYSQGLNAKILSNSEKAALNEMLALPPPANGTIIVRDLFPKFLGITRLTYTNLMNPNSVLNNWTPLNSDVNLTFVNEVQGKYWTMEDYSNENDESGVFGVDNSISIIVASEKAMASILGAIGSLGVIGFYVTITLAVGRLIRGIFDKSSQNVIYEELPKPTDLIELCDAIYLARKEENYKKEEQLYNTLVRIYRSPEMLMELTGSLPIQKE